MAISKNFFLAYETVVNVDDNPFGFDSTSTSSDILNALAPFAIRPGQRIYIDKSADEDQQVYRWNGSRFDAIRGVVGTSEDITLVPGAGVTKWTGTISIPGSIQGSYVDIAEHDPIPWMLFWGKCHADGVITWYAEFRGVTPPGQITVTIDVRASL
jgi:hypothetical protein